MRKKVKNLFRFWPLIYIVVIWFIFSSPYFIKGLVPYPSTYQVNHYHPWSAYPENWGPVKNGAMPDIIDQIYPWKHFTIETYKNGEIPLWNPNSFAGNPHVANFQSAVFSPFNLLYGIFPFVDAWSCVVLLQPLLAGIFMYLFMRALKVTEVGALLSSIAYMFCGFIVTWMAYGTLAMAIAFLPLALYSIQKYFDTGEKRYAILLAITIPLSLFSGHFQISLYFLLYVFAFILFHFFTFKQKSKTVPLWGAFMGGFLLAMPQLVPSIQFYSLAVRSEIFNTAGGIPFSYLITSFVPDFFGNPVTRNDWMGQYAEWASFVGIIPVIFSIFSLYLVRKNKTVFFFVLAVIGSLLLAVDSPVQTIISALKIPVLSTSIPSRAIVLFSFSLAVLAGFGLDTFRIFLEKKDIKKIYMSFLPVIGLITFVWILLFVFPPFSPERIAIAKRNMMLPSFFALLVVGITAFSVIAKRYIKHTLLSPYLLSIIIVSICIVLASFDSLRFAQKWMPFDPKNLVFYDVPVISAMQKNIGYGRVFGNIGNQINSYYMLPGIEGYDPLYIARYGELARSSEKGLYTSPERSVVKLSRHGKYLNRLLDVLGVNLIYHPIADTNQSWAYPVWKDTNRHTLIYSDDKFQLFRNNQALPRAWVFYNYEIISDKRKEISRFYSEDFDFRKIVLLEENPQIPAISSGSGSATITRYTPDRVVITVDSSNEGLLFLSDNYYPGWEAMVNGKPTKIFRADYTFRAVVIPKGKSEVTFEYSGI